MPYTLHTVPDDIPSFADLRRSHTRRPAARTTTSTPSLFDQPPQSNLSPSAQDLSPSAQGALPLAQEQVFSVGQLVRLIRNLVERAHNHVTVEGEISNWRPAASGHCYFTLKDGEAQISIVLFRRQAALLRFRPKDGDAVRISGSLSVYESRGQLQLIAETMQQTGLGALLAATQALKERLRREGIFRNARPLPPFPRCIGIVTSLHGAALRDIVKVCRRRHAAVNLLIYPASVQGPNCPAEVAAGVRWFSQRAQQAAQAAAQTPKVVPSTGAASSARDAASGRDVARLQQQASGLVDVVLVARGGGSWEDLHGFDAEIIARAIAACSIPVITGIGHATDITIADAAADLHAPTPSAAAELLTAAHVNLADRLALIQARLIRSSRYNLLRIRQRISALATDSILRRARTSVERRSQHLDDLTGRAETFLDRSLRARHTRLAQLEARLRRQHVSLRLSNDRHRFQSLQQRLLSARTLPLQAAHTRLNRCLSQLEALSPLRVLERGYALVYGPNGNLLRDPAEAPAGTPIAAQLAKGRLRAKVTGTE